MENDFEKAPFLVAPADREHIPTNFRSKTATTKWLLTMLAHILASISLTVLMGLAFKTMGYGVGSPFGATLGHSSVVLFDNTVLHQETTFPARDMWDQSVFRAGRGNLTETNHAWRKLNHIQGSRISNEEAKRLNLESLPLPGNAQAGVLAVWHNLHCLDSTRGFVEEFSSKTPDEFDRTSQRHTRFQKNLAHIYHCLEVLRTSVMCQPDVNVQQLVWEAADKQSYAAKPEGIRQCVKWDTLNEWSDSRDYHRIDLWKDSAAA